MRGFEVDRIERVSHRLYEGMIPWEWLLLSGWRSEKEDYVPDRPWRSLIAERDPEGNKPGPYYQHGCLLAIRNRNRNGDILTTELIQQDSPTMMVDFLRRTQDVIWNRTLFLPNDPIGSPKPWASSPEPWVSPEPRLGVGPTKARVGDIICILFGCSVPVVLRQMETSDSSTEDDPAYELIGEAFMLDLMDGEGPDDPRRGPGRISGFD